MRWYTTLLYGLLWCIARLPMRLFHALGAALGWLFWVTNDRKRRVIEANLALVRPDLDGRARRRLARDCVRECGIALVEAFGIWTNAQRTLARVREVRGEALFDAALAARKGLILCAPHLGSWEVANYWIGARTPFATFYTQPGRAQVEALLRRLREGGASIQFPIDDAAAAPAGAPHRREGADAVRRAPAEGAGFPDPLPRTARGAHRRRSTGRLQRVECGGGGLRARCVRAIPVELQALQGTAGQRASGRCLHCGGCENLMRWHVALVWWALRAAGLLPLRALYALGTALGHVLWWRRRARERVHTEVNMRIARPDLDEAARARLVRACLIETGHAVTEMAAVWGRGARRALRLVRGVEGLEHFDAALHSGRGLIVAAPHLGCWELLNYWLCSRTRIAILYAPPRDRAWEALLVRARGGLAPEQVRADGAGVRRLYKRLADGGVVGILPDQQPRHGEGQFAPFFGTEANTMVLLPRIAHRTGAAVLFAFAERLPRGAGYRIRILPAPDGIADADLRIACGALNRGVEQCVELAFTQYQWTYKRWAERPDPFEHDPYWLARTGVTRSRDVR